MSTARRRRPSPGRSNEAEPTAGRDDSGTDAVAVEVVKPQPGGITRTSTQPGSVHAYEYAALYAKVSGYLKTLNVDIGDRVKEGQELAVIDDPELVEEEKHAEALLKQAKAAVKQFEAAVEQAKASLLSFEKKVDEAKAEIARYTSTRRFREKELARYKDLYSRQSVPKSVVDEEEEHLDAAVAAESAAKAGVETAVAQVAEAKAKVDKSQADLAEAKEEVQVADSNLAKAKVLVNYMTIRSPYTGVVTERLVHPGFFVRSAAEGSEKPLLSVARTDKMRIVTYVPDRDVPYVDIGDTAEIKLDALRETIEGKVTRFADSEDPDSRTMRTEVIVPNPTGRIRQGMFGDMTIILEKTNAALTIPSGSLVGESKNGKSAVYVVRDGKAKLVPVHVGVDDGLKVEVVAGLTADDQVIITKTGLTDGIAVLPHEARAVAAK